MALTDKQCALMGVISAIGLFVVVWMMPGEPPNLDWIRVSAALADVRCAP